MNPTEGAVSISFPLQFPSHLLPLCNQQVNRAV
jgi:hypothetical protein